MDFSRLFCFCYLIVFADSEAYSEENWANILKMRTLAESGTAADIETLMEMRSEFPLIGWTDFNEVVNWDPGYQFELALVSYKLILTGKEDNHEGFQRLWYLTENVRVEKTNRMSVLVWYARSFAWGDAKTVPFFYIGAFNRLLEFEDFDRGTF